MQLRKLENLALPVEMFKMPKRETTLLRLHGTFEEALGDLLKVKPPEKGGKKPATKRKATRRPKKKS
jgi:hypothetical protein